MAATTYLEVDSRRVKVTNTDKTLYPAAAFTKGAVIDYYRRIAPALLPHLRGRAVTFKRYPDGVEGESFFVKHCTKYRPDWVHTATVRSPSTRREVTYCVIDDLPTLIWAANLAALELHTSLARSDDVLRPTSLVFDLDPGEPATILECVQVALWLREIAQGLGLQSFPKVSGSKGLHVHIPLNTPVTYEQTKPFAHALAERLAGEHPRLILTNMRRADRGGKVFIDWGQNDHYKTTVCAYSLRGRARPTVSAPVSWAEVEAARDPADLVFDAAQVLDRVERWGDLYGPLVEIEQELPPLRALKPGV